jgi:hypothetical protein
VVRGMGSGFHCVAMALIDPDYAKDQLVLFLREWYMHPNGELPAYEWNFSDVNPPVHAWAAWRVYKIAARIQGKPDRKFLVRVFHKLLMNFTWWVNRKDVQGKNVFQGGFLGLDNIGVFDRSSRWVRATSSSNRTAPAGWPCIAWTCFRWPSNWRGTTRLRRCGQQVLRAFRVHFESDERHGRRGHRPVGCERTVLLRRAAHFRDAQHIPMKVRSMVGLIPSLRRGDVRAGGFGSCRFHARMQWFLDHHAATSPSTWT